MDVLLTVAISFLTALLTAAGVTLLGHLLMNPVFEARSLVDAIDADLGFYANVFGNPGTASVEVERAASDTLRKHSVQLRRAADRVPGKRFDWARLGMLPTTDSMREALKELMGLSNSVAIPGYAMENLNTRDKIAQSLGPLRH